MGTETKINDNTNLEDVNNPNMNPQDYKIIVDTVRELEDTYNGLKKHFTDSLASSYGITFIATEDILPFKQEDIPIIDINIIKEFLNKHSTGTIDFEEKEEEYLRNVFDTIKRASSILITSKRECEKIKEESSEILKEYFIYLSSNRVKKSNEERIELLKATAEIELDEGRKQKLLKDIRLKEDMLSFNYLLTRINKYREKELDSINEAFFEVKKGSYVIDKFKGKIGKLGYKEDLFQNFFNLEENFLPEEYHIYNNLFLFMYMRMIAYCNTSDKYEINLLRSLTAAMADLIYHRFTDTESEQHFIDVIKGVLDKFEPYKERYIEHNTSQPGHPARKEAERKQEETRKNIIIAKLKEFGIEGFNENDTIENLDKLLKEQVDKMINEQYPEEESDKESPVEIIIDEENVTNIAPKFNSEETTEEDEEDSSNDESSEESEEVIARGNTTPINVSYDETNLDKEDAYEDYDDERYED